MSTPQEHPQSALRRGEVKRLQTHLATLVTELHILRTTSLAHAEAMYASLFGDLIVEALGAEIAYRRERKRLEFIRVSLAAGVMPDADAIEERLSAEMTVWEAQLEVAIAEALQGQEWAESEHDPERMRELRSLFRELAKRYHPDVVVSADAAYARGLWEQGRALYEARDIEGLRALLLANQGFVEEPKEEEARITALEVQIERAMRDIEDLRARPPLSYWHEMHEESWRAAHREELGAQVSDYEDRRSEIEDEALRLLGFAPDGARTRQEGDEGDEGEPFNAERLNLADLMRDDLPRSEHEE